MGSIFSSMSSTFSGFLGDGGSHDASADDPRIDAHEDRNQHQAGFVPDHLPSDSPFVDPSTSITWTQDDANSSAVFHGNDNTCIRGELPDEMVDDLRADPGYRDDFSNIAGGHGYSVDEVIPGAQACYGPDGGLIESGPHQGTWDFASPNVPGQTMEHFWMDVVPDVTVSDHYTSYPNDDHFSGGGGFGNESSDWGGSGFDGGGGASSGDGAGSDF